MDEETTISMCSGNTKVSFSRDLWQQDCLLDQVSILCVSMGCALVLKLQDESICMLAFLNHYVGIYNKLLREASKAQLRLVHGRPESVEEHEQRLKQLEEEEEG